MRLHIDDKAVLLRVPGALVSWPVRKTAVRTLVDAAKDPQPVTPSQVDGLLARSSSGKKDFTPFARRLGALDAGAYAEDQVAMLLESDDGGVDLVFGKVNTEPEEMEQQDDLEHRIELGELTADIPSWATGLLVDNEADVLEVGGFPARREEPPVLQTNEFGMAVASRATGVVALFRHGNESPVLVFRVRTGPDDRLTAYPTKEGLLMTATFATSESYIARVTEANEAVVLEALSAPPALPVAGGCTLYYCSREGNVIIADGAMEELSRFEIGFTPKTSCVSLDGKKIALADDELILRATVSRNKLRNVKDEKVPKKAKETSTGPAYQPERAHGRPCIGFAVKPVISPYWEVPIGEFEFKLILRSSGGKGKGMQVWFTGDALKHAELTKLVCGEQEAPFEKDGDRLIATLPDITLVAGVQIPLNPYPKGALLKQLAQAAVAETHIHMVVHGKANEVSRHLMELQACAIDGAAPMKWKRPLIVKDPAAIAAAEAAAAKAAAEAD